MRFFRFFHQRFMLFEWARKTNESMNSSGVTSTNLGPSPGQRIQKSTSPEPCNTFQFMKNIKLDLQMQKHQKCVNRELHQKRVQHLRKELEYLKATEWKYQTIDW